MNELTKFRNRYAEQMEKRKEWLEEERFNMEEIEEMVRRIKTEAAPYVAIGDTKVIAVVDEVEASLKDIRNERLKGIPEPEFSNKDLDWLKEKVNNLWDEKLAFGQRRGKWEMLKKRVETALQNVQDMPVPVKPKQAAATTTTIAKDDLDLDLGL
eukprot:TRINITY_DN635_c1_g3_i3.p3 TRINITY_DN635_c1_g3~~TRINITY_DN635_c1_g3_i3.p3  ORF type:complete len:155 (+),score=46.71 TRINITY_DN635_c1_g3_i3:613-1077(+)